jgi:hypothetical protein
VSWDQRFFDPITVPGRKPLVTLGDAALYITKLPKAERDPEEWQAAMEALRSGSTRAVNHTPSLTERGHGAERRSAVPEDNYSAYNWKRITSEKRRTG